MHAASSGVDAKALEDEKVAGAIRTDFILSAEIMAISLASITASDIFMQGVVLFTVGVLVTAGVYGVVAIIVKADDFGVYLAQRGGTISSVIGQVMVHSMPPFLKILSFVGMVAMLWVGGGIIIHGLDAYGIDGPEHAVHVIGDAARTAFPPTASILAWLAAALTAAILGLSIGAVTGIADHDVTIASIEPLRQSMQIAMGNSPKGAAAANALR